MLPLGCSVSPKYCSSILAMSASKSSNGLTSGSVSGAVGGSSEFTGKVSAT
jgi:hypothetical protein